MKSALLVIAVLAVAGCASIENAGHTSYDVTQAPSGKGWELRTKDGKELEGRSIQFHAGQGVLVVEEGASKAFKGQALAVKALGLPTMGLADILAPRDK